MDAILQYFKDNPKLVLVSAISLAVCLVFAIAIIIAKKAINKNRKGNKTENELKAPSEQTSDEQKVEESTEKVEETTFETTKVQEETSEENETVVSDSEGDEKVENVENQTEPKIEKPLNSTVTKQNDDKKADTRYSGKWVIIEEGKRFSAELRASNAEILLRTESYTALSGIKSGIETVKNNVEKNNFAVSMDKNGNFFFKLYSSSTRLLCVSEGYSTKTACERAIESVKRFSKTAVIVREKKDDDK